jgi:hypothetical protein
MSLTISATSEERREGEKISADRPQFAVLRTPSGLLPHGHRSSSNVNRRSVLVRLMRSSWLGSVPAHPSHLSTQYTTPNCSATAGFASVAAAAGSATEGHRPPQLLVHPVSSASIYDLWRVHSFSCSFFYLCQIESLRFDMAIVYFCIIPSKCVY